VPSIGCRLTNNFGKGPAPSLRKPDLHANRKYAKHQSRNAIWLPKGLKNDSLNPSTKLFARFFACCRNDTQVENAATLNQEDGQGFSPVRCLIAKHCHVRKTKPEASNLCVISAPELWQSPKPPSEQIENLQTSETKVPFCLPEDFTADESNARDAKHKSKSSKSTLA
jgi:hypothetical protein